MACAKKETCIKGMISVSVVKFIRANGLRIRVDSSETKLVQE